MAIAALSALSAILLVACVFLALALRKRPKGDQDSGRRLLLLNTLLETMPIGVFMVEAPSGRPLLANEHAKRLLGRGILPDADKMNLQEVYEAYILGTGERYPVERMPIIRGMGGEKSRVSDMKVLRPDGSWSVLEVFGSPIADGSGAIIASLVVFFDITERLEMKEALLHTAEELDSFFMSSLDLLCIADTEGRFIRLNRAWEDILGYPLAELEGRRFLDFVHPDDLNSTQDAIATLASGAEVLNFVNRYRHQDGSWRHIEWRSLPSGSLIYASARDITERLEAERTIAESEQRLRAIIDNLDMVFFAIDRDGFFTLSEGKGLKQLGLKPGEVVGKGVFDFYAGNDEILAGVRRALSGERFIHHVAMGPISFDISYTPVLDEGGSLLYALGAAINVTERVTAEEDRERLREQLDQARKIEALGRLAGGVAHDFNNMLGAILGYAELSTALVEPGSKVQAHLKEIVKAAERSADLTRQLLAFARRQAAHPQKVDLGRALSSMRELLARVLGENIRLDLELPPGPLLARIDPSQLDQVVLNLCANARDAIGGADGSVAIEAGPRLIDEAECPAIEGASAGSWICISVRDNGSGMDGATLSRLFEPFFTTKALHKGTGLGLATIHGIVRQNGGFIEVSSHPGRGSTFRVHLPAVEGLPSTDDNPPAPSAHGAGGGTVLLVEDEAALLQLSGQMLENLGYAVLAAAGPEEALSLARDGSRSIDLLLTDIIMPGMNGVELAARVEELRPGIPCLFMSGYTADGIDPSALNAQGRGFIQKPFSRSLLGAALRRLLDQG